MGKNMVTNYKNRLFLKSLLVMFILCFTSLSMISIADETSNEICMTYTFQSPQINQITIESQPYDQIVLTGAPCSANPGEPSLPTKGAYLLIPFQQNVKQVEVTGEIQYLGPGYHIVPQGEPIPISQSDQISVPECDTEVYSSNALFPGKLFTQTGVHSFRGYSILVLMLHPVQYVPATGELYYYSELTVTVTTTLDMEMNALFRGTEWDKQQVMKKIDNPEVVTSYSTTAYGMDFIEDYDMMILTTDDLVDEFQPLKDTYFI